METSRPLVVPAPVTDILRQLDTVIQLYRSNDIPTAHRLVRAILPSAAQFSDIDYFYGLILLKENQRVDVAYARWLIALKLLRAETLLNKEEKTRLMKTLMRFTPDNLSSQLEAEKKQDSQKQMNKLDKVFRRLVSRREEEGDLAKAGELYDSALRHAHFDEKAHTHYRELFLKHAAQLEKKQDFVEAANYYRRAIQLSPLDHQLIYEFMYFLSYANKNHYSYYSQIWVGVLVLTGNIETVVREAAEQKEKNPDDPKMWIQLLHYYRAAVTIFRRQNNQLKRGDYLCRLSHCLDQFNQCQTIKAFNVAYSALGDQAKQMVESIQALLHEMQQIACPNVAPAQSLDAKNQPPAKQAGGPAVEKGSIQIAERLLDDVSINSDVLRPAVSGSTREQLLQVKKLYAQGNVLGAMQLLNQMEFQGTLDPDFFFLRGLCHLKGKDLRTAHANFIIGLQYFDPDTQLSEAHITFVVLCLLRCFENIENTASLQSYEHYKQEIATCMMQGNYYAASRAHRIARILEPLHHTAAMVLQRPRLLNGLRHELNSAVEEKPARAVHLCKELIYWEPLQREHLHLLNCFQYILNNHDMAEAEVLDVARQSRNVFCWLFAVQTRKPWSEIINEHINLTRTHDFPRYYAILINFYTSAIYYSIHRNANTDVMNYIRGVKQAVQEYQERLAKDPAFKAAYNDLLLLDRAEVDALYSPASIAGFDHIYEQTKKKLTEQELAQELALNIAQRPKSAAKDFKQSVATQPKKRSATTAVAVPSKQETAVSIPLPAKVELQSPAECAVLPVVSVPQPESEEDICKRELRTEKRKLARAAKASAAYNDSLAMQIKMVRAAKIAVQKAKLAEQRAAYSVQVVQAAQAEAARAARERQATEEKIMLATQALNAAEHDVKLAKQAEKAAKKKAKAAQFKLTTIEEQIRVSEEAAEKINQATHQRIKKLNDRVELLANVIETAQQFQHANQAWRKKEEKLKQIEQAAEQKVQQAEQKVRQVEQKIQQAQQKLQAEKLSTVRIFIKVQQAKQKLADEVQIKQADELAIAKLQQTFLAPNDRPVTTFIIQAEEHPALYKAGLAILQLQAKLHTPIFVVNAGPRCVVAGQKSDLKLTIEAVTLHNKLEVESAIHGRQDVIFIKSAVKNDHQHDAAFPKEYSTVRLLLPAQYNEQAVTSQHIDIHLTHSAALQHGLVMDARTRLLTQEAIYLEFFMEQKELRACAYDPTERSFSAVQFGNMQLVVENELALQEERYASIYRVFKKEPLWILHFIYYAFKEKQLFSGLYQDVIKQVIREHPRLFYAIPAGLLQEWIGKFRELLPQLTVPAQALLLDLGIYHAWPEQLREELLYPPLRRQPHLILHYVEQVVLKKSVDERLPYDSLIEKLVQEEKQRLFENGDKESRGKSNMYLTRAQRSPQAASYRRLYEQYGIFECLSAEIRNGFTLQPAELPQPSTVSAAPARLSNR